MSAPAASENAAAGAAGAAAPEAEVRARSLPDAGCAALLGPPAWPGAQRPAHPLPCPACLPQGPTSGAFCSQPPEKGPCRAALTSWYWDGASCKPFLYGGCQVSAGLRGVSAAPHFCCRLAVASLPFTPAPSRFALLPGQRKPLRRL